jgi:hypothetical protein
MPHRRLRDVQREDGYGRPVTVHNHVDRGFREVSRERGFPQITMSISSGSRAEKL